MAGLPRDSARSVTRPLLFCALMSVGFTPVYAFRSEPAWISFWLQILEAAVFVAATWLALRLDVRRRSALLAATFAFATLLVILASHYAWLMPTSARFASRRPKGRVRVS